ncbi:MAG: P-II family nitrogen regulator [Ruminococcaceae bacterium]|nr:P-II family nitrogen regulator [Oscillospiraceae bacterium]
MILYYVMSIVDREKAGAMLDICSSLKLSVTMNNLGFGTASTEHLSLYDLQQTDKAIISTVASEPSMKNLMKSAKRKLFIDIPGNGVVAAIPIKSVSGGSTLAYLTEGQEIGGRTPDMNFENELIVVILNEGFSDLVMDAARDAGATGGTVIHAKGTGKQHAERFYGVSLAEEKDMIYILASSAKKSEIMKNINQKCGTSTHVGAICFSLPVSEVAGIRKFVDE